MNKVLLGLVLLLSFSSAYAGGCFDKVSDVDDCRVKAEQGHADAQLMLAIFYAEGLGVPQDHKQAVKWYRKAAEQGYASALNNLGVRYVLGQGVIQDDVMAHMYWNIAAVSGHKDAAKNRGKIAKRMTPSQLEKTQDLAREWMRNHE